MQVDLTFNNQMIMNYFKGDNSYTPISELIYLHEHPLITRSFLVEIEKIIHQTTEVIINKNINGRILEKFVESTIRLGAELPTINQQTAPTILEELRNVYTLCQRLLK